MRQAGHKPGQNQTANLKEPIMASKKSKTAKNANRKTRQGNTYELTAKGTAQLINEEIGAQPALVAGALKNMKQATAADIALKIDSKLETKQPVMRVVGFYLTTWKKDGLVRVVKAAKAAAAKA
jgi:hypothetical protein